MNNSIIEQVLYLFAEIELSLDTFILYYLTKDLSEKKSSFFDELLCDLTFEKKNNYL